MTKTVLLTGAFGNIGQGTLDKLLAAGHSVVCLDRETPKTREVAENYTGKINTVWGDIADPIALARALEGVEAVIHLVGIIPPLSEQDEELTQRVNVGGTHAIIAAMQASKTAKRLIFASSIAVFGTLQDRQPPLLNDSGVSPTDNYGRTKVAAEQAIRSSGLKWTILRICAAPPVEIPDGGAHDISIMFEMSADARVEFVHADDVSTAFCSAVGCDGSIGKSLFLGGGKACQLSGLEFATNMVRGNGITGKLPAAAFKPGPIPEFYGDWVDTQESQRLLQFQHHTMEDFIGHMQAAMGWKYYLIRLISPLARRAILKHSPYL